LGRLPAEEAYLGGVDDQSGTTTILAVLAAETGRPIGLKTRWNEPT